MAVDALSPDELRELVGVLAGALECVAGELETVCEIPNKMPDEAIDHLEQRDALVRVLEKLPEELRGRIRTLYVEERGKVHRDDIYLPWPNVLDDNRELVEETLERVRCAHLRDGALWRAVAEEEPAHA